MVLYFAVRKERTIRPQLLLAYSNAKTTPARFHLAGSHPEPLTAACFPGHFPEDVGSLQQGQGLVVPVADTGISAS